MFAQAKKLRTFPNKFFCSKSSYQFAEKASNKLQGLLGLYGNDFNAPETQ